MSYAFPDAGDGARRLPRLFGMLLASDGAAGLRLMREGCEAATLWRGSGRGRTGWGEMLRRSVPLLSALGGSVRRALRVSAAIEARVGAGDFRYLHSAGCDPAVRGRGFGSAAMRAGLSRIGAPPPAYLATGIERNVGFCQRLTFAVTPECRVPGGPHFWSMPSPAERMAA